MSTFGKEQFKKIKKHTGKCPTSKVILQYLFDKYTNQTTSDMNSFQQLKKQHLIKYMDSFYRKTNGSDQIFEISNDPTKILLDQEPTSNIINIDQNNVNEIKYINIPSKIIKKNTIFYHGTPYQMPTTTDHMPYNWAGNWFGSNIDESVSYLFGEDDFTPRLYKYKVTKDFNVINIIDETDLIYLLIHVAFMETVINMESEEILITVKFARGRQLRSGYPIIEKYNYTTGKNLQNPSGNDQYGLYDNTGTNKIADTFQIPIKLASNGDGDKPLAGTICNLYNSNDPYSININGWIISAINHLMICNPTQVLENISGSKGDTNFTPKDDPEYNDYYKKYLKYKAKYLQLKKLKKN